MTPDSAGIESRDISPRETRRLWSLWDMLRQFGYIFHILGGQLERVRAGCELLNKGNANDPGIANSFSETIISVQTLMKDLDLKASLAQANRIKTMISAKNYGALAIAAKELSSRIEDELNGQWFVYIKAEHISYYTSKTLFGEDVESKFPSTNEDIENAGKCLAVGQDTAAVFHLMRAMEAAVNTLSTKLNIPHPEREWGKLLSDIHGKIENMPKGDARDAWSECHANLYHVKQVWRNKTMHPKATYTPEQAVEVFRATRVFMTQLATLI